VYPFVTRVSHAADEATATGAGRGSSRVTKRRAETRHRLVSAAYSVFAEKGFGHVRIEDVCSAAGYTRGAFYSQFTSLDELFFVLYDRHAAVIAEQVSAALADVDDSDDLLATIDRVASTLLLDRKWLLIKTDFLMHAARHPEVAERLAMHRAQLRVLIEDSVATATIPIPKAFGNVSEFARAVIAVYDGVTVQLLIDHDLPAARQWFAQLLAAYLPQ
jgi:AcrR family transcriptional regulator